MGNSKDSVFPDHRAKLGSDANSDLLRLLLQMQDLGSMKLNPIPTS